MLMELKDVSYTYPGAAQPALAHVDLTLEPGQLVMLIGPGGSGKSTLALLLAGLLRPDSGHIDAGDLSRPGDDIYRGAALLFQYPEQQLFAETVFDEVAFGARNFGVPADYLRIRVHQALNKVGLEPESFVNRSPFDLSGGQMRRVCLAGILAVEPRLLILDEPGAGLDAAGRAWLAQLVRDLHELGRTIVWITHDMTEAAELAQRLIVLDSGHILLDGSPEQVFSQEEALLAAGLALPPAAWLVRRLKEKGAALPGAAVTAEGACQEILNWRQGPPEAEEELPPAPVAEDAEPELDLAALLPQIGRPDHAQG